MKVKEAINTLNNKRKERLMLLLEYIEDQGSFLVHLFFVSFGYWLLHPK